MLFSIHSSLTRHGCLKPVQDVFLIPFLILLFTLSFFYTSSLHAQSHLDLSLESGYFCQGNQEVERSHGGYGLVGVQFPFTSSLVLTGAYSGTKLTQNRHAHRLHLGIRYRLDVFTYVPWVGLKGYYTVSSSWPIQMMDNMEMEESTDNIEETTLTPLDEPLPMGSNDLEGWGNQGGVFFEIGVDRYLLRQLKLGVVLRFQALPFIDSVPFATSAGLSLSYQWTLFDPFAE